MNFKVHFRAGLDLSNLVLWLTVWAWCLVVKQNLNCFKLFWILWLLYFSVAPKETETSKQLLLITTKPTKMTIVVTRTCSLTQLKVCPLLTSSFIFNLCSKSFQHRWFWSAWKATCSLSICCTPVSLLVCFTYTI